MLWILWSTVAALLGAVAYHFLTKPYKYWTDKGVKQSSPVPVFGDNWGTVTRRQSFAEFVQHIYNIWPNTRYTGIYQFFLPTLVVKDPELIKQITVKDFDHFTDHRSRISPEVDPIFGRNLFELKGEQWHNMRSTLSPAFTSSKMRQMFVLISEVAEQFVDYFLEKNEGTIVVEMKDIFTRFTNDVIASTAFGINCDSLKEPNNEFYLMGKQTTDFSGIWRSLKFFGFFLVPKIYSLFKLQLLDENITKFFHKLVTENIASRELNGIIRPDMINLLMQAKTNGLKYEEDKREGDAGFATAQESDSVKKANRKIQITDTDIVAQTLLFFFGGFDSVSSLMCFMSHEIAVNPGVQEKLREEVDRTYHDCDGELNYDTLLQMKYMDMVISETLRKWPNAVGVDRVCTKSYVIQPKTSDERPVYVSKNDLLIVPIFGIHRDPKYYPDPEKFDPERFNDDNKHKINPYTYLPFGIGPRSCIGSRLALLETKALFFYVLSNFDIIPVEKTTIPLKIDRKRLNLLAEGGFWLGLRRRDIRNTP